MKSRTKSNLTVRLYHFSSARSSLNEQTFAFLLRFLGMLRILVYSKLKPIDSGNATDRVLAECERHVLWITADLDKNRAKG